MEKAYWTVEERRHSKRTLIHDINNSILIYHPSYSDLYLDEAKKLKLYQDTNIFLGYNQTKNKLTKIQCTLLMK